MYVSLLSVACGGGQQLRVDDSRLVRLSPDARQEIIDGESNVSIADTNLGAARVAQAEAREFKTIVATELEGARERRMAAEKSVALGKSSRDVASTRARAEQLADADARVARAAAKKAYADELVEHRDAVVDLREAELDAARAELEAAKVARLQAEGQAAGLDRTKFDRAVSDRRQQVAELTARAASELRQADERREAWQSLRTGDLARGGSEDGGVDAPPAPKVLERR